MILYKIKKNAQLNVQIEVMIIYEQQKKQKYENIQSNVFIMIYVKIISFNIILFRFLHQIQNNAQQKIQLVQQMINNDPNCILCYQNIDNFNTLITQSLYGKYSSSQNFYFTKQVNEILDEAITPAYINFCQNNYYDHEEQFMKRQYKQQEFSKKIDMLTQYYKFHRNLPVWNERPIQSIMERYYNRLKDVDYKKIKSVLKRQQGISLTTHKSCSSFEDSEFTKKSRYSTLLNDLQASNDSLMLKSLCEKIGKAFKKITPQINFKGTYYSGDKKFEEFLKKQNKRKQKKSIQENENKKKLGFKKLKFNPKLITRDDEIPCLKQVNFTSNHSIKQRKYPSKITISIQKTKANQTVSRQQKVRRERSKSNFNVNSSRKSISRKISTARNPIIQQLLYPPKVLNGQNLLLKINKDRKKTIHQIYKTTEKYDKNIRQQKKSSAKQFIDRLKVRSKSQNNLPTTQTLARNPSKNKLISSIKPNINQSKKDLNTHFLSQKDSTQLLDKKKSVELSKQDSHRVLKSNSTKNFVVQNNQKQYKTNNQLMKTKRKSGIEQLLEKKLNVLKRKPIVL